MCWYVRYNFAKYCILFVTWLIHFWQTQIAICKQVMIIVTIISVVEMTWTGNHYICCSDNANFYFCSTFIMMVWVLRNWLYIMESFCSMAKVKSKVFPVYAMKVHRGEQRYSAVAIFNQGTKWLYEGMKVSGQVTPWLLSFWEISMVSIQ
jgi:hypothetical protein